jgi:hypothetical protein
VALGLYEGEIEGPALEKDGDVEADGMEGVGLVEAVDERDCEVDEELLQVALKDPEGENEGEIMTELLIVIEALVEIVIEGVTVRLELSVRVSEGKLEGVRVVEGDCDVVTDPERDADGVIDLDPVVVMLMVGSIEGVMEGVAGHMYTLAEKRPKCVIHFICHVPHIRSIGHCTVALAPDAFVG